MQHYRTARSVFIYLSCLGYYSQALRLHAAVSKRSQVQGPGEDLACKPRRSGFRLRQLHVSLFSVPPPDMLLLFFGILNMRDPFCGGGNHNRFGLRSRSPSPANPLPLI